MAAPMIKPSHKGLLHKKLGVPQGEKIPEAKIAKAKHSKSPALRKEATFAQNFGHKKGKGEVRHPQSHAEFEKLGKDGDY